MHHITFGDLKVSARDQSVEKHRNNFFLKISVKGTIACYTVKQTVYLYVTPVIHRQLCIVIQVYG